MIELTEAEGERIFVIGDIHGCAAEVDVLMNFLMEKESITKNDLVVFLGDYIDRGPDSRSVLDILISFKNDFPATRFLRGNHEDMLLDFLGFGGNLGHSFLYNGGLETIQSYGISVFSPPQEMMELLPESHFSLLSNLDSIISVDGHYLVHAGLNPERPIKEQVGGDVFWIREPFLDVCHNFEKVVVFGHTPHRDVFDHRPFKLGLDTGLVFGHKLTCLELKSGDIFQVFRGSNEVTVDKLPAV